MDADAEKRVIMYANETTMSLSNGDAVLNFRWVTPKYDENNNPVGKNVEKEIIVSMPISMFHENATMALKLFDTHMGNMKLRTSEDADISPSK